MSKTSRVVDEVIASMQNRPDDFVFDAYTLEDKKTGLEYWIGNGRLSYGIYKPFKMRFGLYHGWRFSRALRRLTARKAIALLSQGKKIETPT